MGCCDNWEEPRETETRERLERLNEYKDQMRKQARIRQAKGPDKRVYRILGSGDGTRIEKAKDDFGENLISPAEVTKAFRFHHLLNRSRFTYSARYQDFLWWFPVEHEALKRILSGEYYIIPGPPDNMTIHDLCNLSMRNSPGLIIDSHHGFDTGTTYEPNPYGEYSYIRNELVTTHWIAIRKRPTSRPRVATPTSCKAAIDQWLERVKLLEKYEYVPGAADLLWTILVLSRCRTITAFDDLLVGTSSKFLLQSYQSRHSPTQATVRLKSLRCKGGLEYATIFKPYNMPLETVSILPRLRLLR